METTPESVRDPQRKAALLFAALAGPFAWALELQVTYTAVPFLCGSAWTPILYVVPMVALLIAAAGFVVGHRNWRALGASGGGDGPGPLGRSRLLALSGVVLGAFFLIVVVVQALPTFFLDPCVKGA